MMKQPIKKIISCTKIIEFKHLGTFMYKLRCKWENKDEILVQDLEEVRQEVYRYRQKYFIVQSKQDYIRTFQNIINSAD